MSDTPPPAHNKHSLVSRCVQSSAYLIVCLAFLPEMELQSPVQRTTCRSEIHIFTISEHELSSFSGSPFQLCSV
jgi:hypothetical protein